MTKITKPTKPTKLKRLLAIIRKAMQEAEKQ